MTKTRTLLISLALAAVASSIAGAAPASAVTVDCGAKRMTVLFWPRGHGSQKLAFMSFYRLTRQFTARNLYGSIDREGGGTFVPACHKRKPPALRGGIHRKVRTKRATQLRCGFTGKVLVDVHPISQEDEELGIDLLVGRQRVLSAELWSDKPPVLAYDKKLCHASAPPR